MVISSQAEDVIEPAGDRQVARGLAPRKKRCNMSIVSLSSPSAVAVLIVRFVSIVDETIV